jgi:flagellar motor switch protein FliG
MSTEEMSPVDKVALLIMLLSPDASAKLLQGMDEEQIKTVTSAMCKLGDVPNEVREKVLAEFHAAVEQERNSLLSGPDSVRKILQNAVGSEKATGLVNAIFRSNSFDFLANAPMRSLADQIKDEHPQTVAVIMGQLSTEQAAELLALLPEKTRNEVLKRSGSISAVSDEAMAEIGGLLKAAMSSVKADDGEAPERIADIISLSAKQEADAMLADLQRSAPELAQEVVKRLVTFEKILTLSDASVQKVLRKLDQRTLATSLSGAPQNISEKIYKNMTEEASKAMMEDIETLGQVSPKAVEEARRKMVKAIKALSDAGELAAA